MIEANAFVVLRNHELLFIDTQARQAIIYWLSMRFHSMGIGKDWKEYTIEDFSDLLEQGGSFEVTAPNKYEYGEEMSTLIVRKVQVNV